MPEAKTTRAFGARPAESRSGPSPAWRAASGRRRALLGLSAFAAAAFFGIVAFRAVVGHTRAASVAPSEATTGASHAAAPADGTARATPVPTEPSSRPPSPAQSLSLPPATRVTPEVCRQTWTYDSEGNVLTHIDRRGITTVNAYDRENRLVSESRAGLMLQTVERDADGNVRRQTDALGRVTTFTYDKANRKLSEDRSGLAVERWTYTPLGDVATYTDADGRTTTNTYTPRRLLESESLAGETTRYAYDGAGHRLSRERPNGLDSTWTYAYDAAGNLAVVTDPDAHTTKFGHDANNNRTQVTNANEHVTTFAYDERNRLAAKTYPGGDRWRWVYDGDGNRIRSTAPNGRVTDITYDALNRPTRTTYLDAPVGEVQSTAYTYDGNGNVRTTTETGSAGTRTETRDYDDFDRLTEATDGDGRTVRYAYDAVGNRTRLTDADGNDTVWTYNDLNQNTRVTVPGMGSTSLGYAPSGRVTEINRPSGSLTEQTFFDDGRLQSIRHSKAGQTLARYDYVYDPNGNRTEQREFNGATTADTTQRTRYVYDDADRLVEVKEPDRTTTYTLDAVGNRIAERVVDGNGVVLSDSILTYDERDQLTSRRDPTADVHGDQTWDANGNLATQTVDGQPPRIYTYDARDRLVGLTLPSSPNGPTTLRFAYHADGLRREKTDGVTTTHYQYDGQSLLAETNAIGNTLRQFHYSATQLIGQTQAGTTPVHRHVLLDALRSPIALLDPTGLVTARTSYDAFGEIRAQLGTNGTLTTPDRDAATAELVSTDSQPIGFTGYVKDTESGLYYAKARYYDPATARFTTEDPEAGNDLEPPSLHRYLYAYANPATYTDRTGRCANVIMADDAFCQWMQYEQDALITGADLDTQEGIRSVSQYQIGKSEGHLSGTWSTLKDTTQFLADIPGTLADFIPGVDFGSLGRMRGRATDAMVFVSSPLSTVNQGIQQYEGAFYGAIERGDLRSAGRSRGSVEGSIATGVTLGAVTPPLVPRWPTIQRLVGRGAQFVATEASDGTTALQMERRIELLAENDFVGPAASRSGQRVEGRTHYRGVELTNQRGTPIAEFDEIDIEKGVLYEDKEALGFGTTGNGSESALQKEISRYVNNKVIDKATAKITALVNAVNARANPDKRGSLTAPSLESIQDISRMKFRFEGDHPILQDIMDRRLEELRQRHPNYSFDVEYGYKPEVKQ
ncbi:RHS repeat-associated core domain-containing protein [Tahibacter caeni]|uniref:RHS repeat-associated core domain-containing protein n=1 Tax=Tahibacter caeni TaxID=1453545 RepID=UPI002149178C|nr:RHS repeat-associated core domain-containing protein [Tahibacter caeni]